MNPLKAELVNEWNEWKWSYYKYIDENCKTNHNRQTKVCLTKELSNKGIIN